MQVILFDTELRNRLFPFSHLRPVADIRTGILSFREKWFLLLGGPVMTCTPKYLQRDDLPESGEWLFINSALYPEKDIVEAIRELREGNSLRSGNHLIASRDPGVVRYIREEEPFPTGLLPGVPVYKGPVSFLEYPWQIFQRNREALMEDYLLITRNRESRPVSPTNRCIAPENIFLEEGVTMEHCILNASEGPIYLGKNTLIMEGSCIRGGFALGEGSVVKMGAKVYGATAIGPHCIVGGEIKNSVMLGYSNKAHDGYLGDSVIGEWCNLGAGTSVSNLKNSAGMVKIWSEAETRFSPAAAKCGLLMGDYAKSAINTSFNTGTVVGIGANVFTTGLTPKYIPPFSWGGGGQNTYEFEKAMSDFANWKRFKDQELADWEVRRLKHIFDRGFQPYTT